MQHSRQTSGFALITTVVGLALLAVIVLRTSQDTGHQLADILIEREILELEAAADAGVSRGLLALTGGDNELAKRLDPEGRKVDWTFSAFRVTLSVQGVSGLVDLNDGDLETLDALITDVAGATTAARLTSSIEDRRTSGAPIQSTEFLRAASDLESTSVVALERQTTVHSGQRALDPETAPLAVLRSIPGMDAGSASRIVEDRRTTDVRSVQDVRNRADQFGRALPVYRIRASAFGENAEFTREAIVYLGDPSQRPIILSWRRGSAAD